MNRATRFVLYLMLMAMCVEGLPPARKTEDGDAGILTGYTGWDGRWTGWKVFSVQIGRVFSKGSREGWGQCVGPEATW